MVFSALRYLGIVLSGSCLPYCFSLYISCIHTCIHTCIQAYCVCMCAPSPIPWPTDPMPAGPRTVGRPYTRHLGRDTYLGTRDTCLCIRDTCLCTHARTQIHTLRVCICVFPKPPVRARTHDGSRDYFITDKTVPFFITDARAGTRTLPRSWTHARVHATQAYARTHADKHTRAHARTLT